MTLGMPYYSQNHLHNPNPPPQQQHLYQQQHQQQQLHPHQQQHQQHQQQHIGNSPHGNSNSSAPTNSSTSTATSTMYASPAMYHQQLNTGSGIPSGALGLNGRGGPSWSAQQSEFMRSSARFDASRSFDIEDDIEFCPVISEEDIKRRRIATSSHSEMPYMANSPYSSGYTMSNGLLVSNGGSPLQQQQIPDYMALNGAGGAGALPATYLGSPVSRQSGIANNNRRQQQQQQQQQPPMMMMMMMDNGTSVPAGMNVGMGMGGMPNGGNMNMIGGGMDPSMKRVMNMMNNSNNNNNMNTSGLNMNNRSTTPNGAGMRNNTGYNNWR